MVAPGGRRAAFRPTCLAIIALTATLLLSGWPNAGGTVGGTYSATPVAVHSAPAREHPLLPRPAGTTVAFPPPNWRPLNTSSAAPPAIGGSLAFLPASSDVVWAGGDYDGNLQTWEFASGNWTNLTASASGAPPANPGGRLAAAPFQDEVAWTSPYAGSGSMGLWTFANGTWTNDSALTPAPPARVDGAWASDPAAGTIVLFGGEANGVYFNDTWALDASGWSAISSSSAPAPRSDAGLAAPGSTVDLVLTGGVGDAGPFNDTWTLTGTSWTVEPSAGAPAAITFGPNALTPTPGGDVLAFGGSGCATANGLCNDTFEYAPTTAAWKNVTSQYPPSPRAGMQLTYDPASRFILAFGGAIGAGDLPQQSWAIGGPLVDALVVTPPVAQPPSNSWYVSHAAGGYGTYTYFYHGQNVDCISRNVSAYLCPLDNDDNGNYTITAQVTDQMGNVTTATTPFHVLVALTVLTNISASTVDVGQPVNYSMSVSAPSVPVIIRWQDLPPDCPFTNRSSFTCASFDPGFYGVSCNVTDQYGTIVSSTTVQLVVAPAPSVLAWPSVTAGTAPLTVGFESRVVGGTAPYTYNWSFGDGSFGATAAPTHTYTANGTFVVNLTVTDAVGYVQYTASAMTITVTPGLAANITAHAISWVAPATVQLTVGVVGGSSPYTYRWSLGNGASASQPTATATYATPGSYSVSVVVVDARGLVATASSVVTVTASNSTGGAGTGGSSSTPAWELPVIGVAGVVIGLLAGIAIGRRRPGTRSDPSTGS